MSATPSSNPTNPTSSFSSKVGLVMAAAGSAVGLGNIWKFPYIAGQNGGGAFLIIYLLCVLAFGLPLLMTEFIIGKSSHKSAYGAFKHLCGNNKWQWLSWLSMLTAILIMGFYFIVTGWCVSYLVEALTDSFAALDTAQLTQHFKSVTSNPLRMITFSAIALALTVAVVWFDVNKGIERLSKILMPLLLLMMILMAGRVLMLDGSTIGMRFFFQPDFSKVTGSTILVAMGQAFFSLSIGMGALITYGAYMPKSQNITTTSVQVVVLDTLVAILAGLIIFPAVFAFNFNPAEGPELVFVVLPAIFGKMSFAWLSAVLFFTLLCIAAITSTISLMEVSVAFFTEATANLRHPLNRHKSALVTAGLVMVLIVFSVLTMTGVLSIGKYSIFDILDQLTSCVLMPLGALGMAVFLGWFVKKDVRRNALYPSHKNIAARLWRFTFTMLIRFVVPVAILIIFLNTFGIL